MAKCAPPLARVVAAVTLGLMNPASRLRENLDSLRAAITEAACRSGRDPGAIRLVAVTKMQEPDLVRELFALGVADLGENYPQALWGKASDLADLAVRWHLIGHLQGNKVARTVPIVRMIHSVDSLKLLRALDALNLTDPPRICLQVNCSGESSKHGWSPAGLLDDAEAISACRKIPIAGLMTIAGLDSDASSARAAFSLARELKHQLAEKAGLVLPELSMGMSGDFREAIAEGATLIRIGSVLFEGTRE